MVNYKELGFKAGLEIHQQLDIKKLFCDCPSLVNDPNEEFYIVKRKLNITEGESGKEDVAARYELSKNKTFFYQAKKTSSCLVELDEEPPHRINEQAIKIALQVCKLLNAKIVSEIVFMRKIVLDGSNVSGFQRTALIGRNGHINTSKGKVSIPTVYLEEEAAKKINENNESVTYSLDRLGVALLEISTAAELMDAEYVKESASIIGMILRSLEKVKRGIGSIRQDVNLSIKGSPRIELKGFQDLRSMTKVIENEVERLLKEKDKVPHVRKVEPNLTSTYLRPMPGAARMYPETDVPIFEVSEKLVDSIKIPELISERAVNFEKKYGINPQYALEIVKGNLPFDYYAEKYKIDPKIIAHSLIEIPKELKKRFNFSEELKKEDFDFIFENLEKKKINNEALLDILYELGKGNKIDLNKYSSLSLNEIEVEVKKTIKENPGVSVNGLMGDLMKKFKGRVDGKLVISLIKRFKNE